MVQSGDMIIKTEGFFGRREERQSGSCEEQRGDLFQFRSKGKTDIELKKSHHLKGLQGNR